MEGGDGKLHTEINFFGGEEHAKVRWMTMEGQMDDDTWHTPPHSREFSYSRDPAPVYLIKYYWNISISMAEMPYGAWKVVMGSYTLR